MDASRFDYLARSLTDIPSRRGLLSGLAATAIGLAAVRFFGGVEARKNHHNRKKRHKKKHNRKKKPNLILNAFGCVDVGGACAGNSANCCSGVCQGTKPKDGQQDTSGCLAHDVQECQDGDDFCAAGDPLCGTSGHCFRTTGAASFCGRKGDCAFCAKDADCEADFGPGAACVLCATCGVTNNTTCVPPAALA
jgi:hypothetical protein